MHSVWVRQLREECLEEGRAFFFKQWGDGTFTKPWLKGIRRTIDGREWNESPWLVPLPINADGHPCLSLNNCASTLAV
jgi:protein gp37